MTPELLEQLPAGFLAWPPAAQAGAVFFSTFILEDVAAVGAGLLLAAGALVWPTAFWACFLGIWLGDVGLYALARVAGRTWFERPALKRFSQRIKQSERWFVRHGSSILIFSRLLPGARLPTYLAAGFLRLPLDRFLAITGAAALVWTVIVLALTDLLGVRLVGWLRLGQQAGGAVYLGTGLTLVFLHVVKKLARAGRLNAKSEAGRSTVRPAGPTSVFGLKRLTLGLARWRHWEFWPPWIFYAPVALHCLWLAVKYRGLTLPTAANPGIFTGGVVGESKMATLRELMATSPGFTAEVELLTGTTPDERLAALREICQRRKITCPFILKPDIGQRGVGVKLIRSEEQAVAYLKHTDAACQDSVWRHDGLAHRPPPLLVQCYVEGPGEVGVFYYRFPGEPHGHIFAITEKIFPTVTGDGRSTLAELVWNDPRARFLAAQYLDRLSHRRDEVPPAGERVKLVETGNHAQGCVFRDGRHLCTPALAARIDDISRRLPGFFIGRYDLRYASEADLRAGMNFQIVELNGAASEATSIYDARNSLVAAYRTLFRQWDLVFAIGAANRRRGCAPTRLSVLWRSWRAYSAQAAGYPAAD
jgi:membrane protein DedA with SNARE-associated domain